MTWSSIVGDCFESAQDPTESHETHKRVCLCHACSDCVLLSHCAQLPFEAGVAAKHRRFTGELGTQNEKLAHRNPQTDA